MSARNSIASALEKRGADVKTQWSKHLGASIARTKGRISAEELNDQMRHFLDVFTPAVQSNKLNNIAAPEWDDVRSFLDDLSRRRVLAGFSSDETATFVFSLKRPLFDALRDESANNAEQYAADVWEATELLDQLGLHTVKTFQRAREEVISRQQQELLELSTPVVKLWDGILALPMIGTLDSARTQVVMESLLQKIVETESQIAIIDITGVPTVDTLVAQHLLKTVTALRLMGADCIISGVRPQIAQTIVHLGVDLQGVTTKANLADALALALKRTGVSFTKQP
ncbi:MAG: rsbT co-antagonist protein RsbR [Gammaproteobacteria bacterium]|nr:rsbT co-antagonist protein RsbR [Gammaproteobacteria bacterium]